MERTPSDGDISVGPPTGDDLQELLSALVRSRPEEFREHRRALGAFIRGDEGELLAGIAGHTQFGWLCIEQLWVDESTRGRGLGTRLLIAGEDEARARGCRAAWVDTYSFQARPFYETHGYRLFGELDDYPVASSRYFLHKKL